MLVPAAAAGGAPPLASLSATGGMASGHIKSDCLILCKTLLFRLLCRWRSTAGVAVSDWGHGIRDSFNLIASFSYKT
jgi:hypothetical protein